MISLGVLRFAHGYGNLKEGDKVTVLQTGGEMNGIVTTEFAEVPLFDINDQYLLFLQHTNEGHYLILGGYQGVGELVNDQIVFAKENHVIAEAFSNGKLSEVVNQIANQIEENATIENDLILEG